VPIAARARRYRAVRARRRGPRASARSVAARRDPSREGRATREIAFRNYVPRDGALAAAKLPATTAPALDVAAARDGDEGAVTPRLEPNVGDVDPGMVAPRRANWDLKRDVEARLEKLERRTRRALVDVAREEARARAAMDA
jgi:coiled-coil domain-containing protein 12